MITLQQITLNRGPKILLDNISHVIYAQQKIGLIGENGCGKTSFFAMLQSVLEPLKGELYLPKNLRVTHVKQEIPHSDQTALDYVIDGDQRYRTIQANLQKAEETHDMTLLADCHEELLNIDGYAITGKAEKILRGLGFKPEQLQKATRDFSGGWRMRLNLAQALISPTDLLLLDEPTNHLDLDAIIWLEKWLQDFDGTLLIISHDREFLDNTVNAILHLENNQLKSYKGNYSDFEKQRILNLSVQQATFEKQQAKIQHMQSFVDRFRAKASKARQAQSRLKALEKMELIAAVETQSKFSFTFKPPKTCPNPLVRMEKAVLGYESNPVLNHIEFQIAPAERIGLLGINGAGKSTFIKSLMGIIPLLQGQIHHYKGLKIGYFAQHQIEYLDVEKSPLVLLQDIAPQTSEQVLRNFLGNFNFSGDMATGKLANYSGGEKARLALALIVWQAPNLLLLDEPTNHLDMDMREALALALQSYTGAMILVSHDRHLIRTTTDELLLIYDHKLTRFQGDLDDYKEVLLNKGEIKIDSGGKTAAINPGKEKRKLETRLKSLEKQISDLMVQRTTLDEAFLKLSAQGSSEDMKKLVIQQASLDKEIAQLESDCLEIMVQLEG